MRPALFQKGGPLSLKVKKKMPNVSKLPHEFEQININAAGIDIGIWNSVFISGVFVFFVHGTDFNENVNLMFFELFISIPVG